MYIHKNNKRKIYVDSNFEKFNEEKGLDLVIRFLWKWGPCENGVSFIFSLGTYIHSSMIFLEMYIWGIALFWVSQTLQNMKLWVIKFNKKIVIQNQTKLEIKSKKSI